MLDWLKGKPKIEERTAIVDADTARTLKVVLRAETAINEAEIRLRAARVEIASERRRMEKEKP